MREITVLLLFSIIVMAIGCPKNVPQNPAALEYAVNYEIKRLDADLKRYQCAAALELFEENTGNYRACSNGEKDLAKAREVRNEVINRLTRTIDHEYFRFEEDLVVRRTSGSFLADFTDIGLGLATTISNGERVKTVLGAVITSFRGWRKAGSLNYYREQTVELLITKMQTSRTRIMTQILKQINEDTSDERIGYTLDAALNDTLRYFYAGTLYRAFQELQEDTSIAALEAKREFRNLQVKSSKPVSRKSREQADTADRILDSYRTALRNNQTAAVKDKLKRIYTKMQADPEIKPKISSAGVSPDSDSEEKLIDGIEKIRANIDDEATDQGNSDLEKLIDKINDIVVEEGKINP